MVRRGKRRVRRRSRKVKRTKISGAAITKALFPVHTFRNYTLQNVFTTSANSGAPILWYIASEAPTFPVATSWNQPLSIGDIAVSVDKAGAGIMDISTGNIKTVMSRMKVLHTVKNIDLTPVHLDIFICSIRTLSFQSTTSANRDILAKNILADLVAGWDAVSNAADIAMWESALLGRYAAGATTQFTSSILAQSPYDSSEFCHKYKIISRKSFHLNPGQSVRIPLRYKQYIFDATSDVLTQSMYLPGTTKFILVRQRGDLGVVALNTSTAGLSNTNVAWELRSSANVAKIGIGSTRFIAYGNNALNGAGLGLGPYPIASSVLEPSVVLEQI